MAVCDLPLMSSVCSAVTGAGDSLVNGIGGWIVKATAGFAQSAADLAARATDATTTVDLNAAWFRDNYELLLPIGLVLTVATFCLQLITAAWQRDDRALTRAVSGTVGGIVFAFSAIALTSVALTVVDALSDGLFAAANTNLEDAVRKVVLVGWIGAANQISWIVPTVFALLMAFGALMFWAVLLLRKVGILILVTLAVFVGAAGGWDATRKWRRGWIEATATLVFSKLVMTIVFLLGLSAIGKPDVSKDGVQAMADMLAGFVILALVTVTPFAVYKFIHWTGETGAGPEAHHGAAAGVATAARAAKQAASAAGGVTAGQSTSGIAPQGPATVPGQIPAGGTEGSSSATEPEPPTDTSGTSGTATGTAADTSADPATNSRTSFPAVAPSDTAKSVKTAGSVPSDIATNSSGPGSPVALAPPLPEDVPVVDVTPPSPRPEGGPGSPSDSPRPD